MGRDQSKAPLRDRTISRRESRIADFLGVNCLKLGAGAAACVISCSMMSGFAAAEVGPVCTQTDADQQVSQIRLKPFGATISFQPIVQSGRAVSIEEPTQPRSTPIHPGPMTGGAVEILDQPVLAGHATSKCAQECKSSEQDETNHPQILSIRRLDLKSTAENHDEAMQNPHPAAADLQAVASAATAARRRLPPSVLAPTLDSDTSHETSQASSFSSSDAADRSHGNARDPLGTPGEKFNDADEMFGSVDARMGRTVELASDVSEPRDEVEATGSLPLLPIPNRQWVASQASDSVNQDPVQQRLQHLKITAPRTISLAHVKRLSTPHAGVSVPAQFSSYTRAVPATPPLPGAMALPVAIAQPGAMALPVAIAQPRPVAKPLDATAVMMEEIHDRYPDAQVVLADADGRLVVRGNCSDRKHAIAIIRMVRSRLLIPVDDCLVIR